MKSLQTRIQVAVVSVMLLTVGTVVILVNRNVEGMVVRKENLHAQETLDLALMTIRNEGNNYVFHREALLAERRDTLKGAVANALGVIGYAYSLSQDGLMTVDQAQKLARESVRQMRFSDGTGYVWIQDCQLPIPTMLMHPAIPETEGNTGNDPRFYEALDGDKNLLSEFVRQTENGSAYVPYRWPKPTPGGLTSMQPKLSFVTRFEPWGWLLGSGLYIDDIEKTSRNHRERMMADTMKLLREVRLMESGYLYIFDSNGVMLLHPRLELGRGYLHLINPETGNPIFQDIMDAAHRKDGRLEYLWNKPGQPEEDLYRKIAYVRYFEPFDWYIASSIYSDELQAPARGLSERILWVAAGLLLITIVLSWWLVRSIVRPLTRLAEAAHRIQSEGVDNVESRGLLVAGPDEVETLGERLHQLVHSLRDEQARLRHSQRMDAVGQLAGGIAHDFNNMLGGIMGATELIQKDDKGFDPKTKQLLSLIDDSAQKAADLAAQLLAFSRKQTVASRPLSLHQVISDSIDILKHTIDRRVVIETGLGADECTIIGDSSQLQSVFLNLGINASHAMPEGGVLGFESRIVELDEAQCSISTFELKPGPHIDVVVRDNGNGISPDNLDKIFEPFFTTKAQGKGTGLGLAACYGTVQQHNGAISVYSEEGVGTTFVLTFPLTLVEPQSLKEKRPIEQGEGTVLLVDDEAVMRVTGEAMLVKYGYNVMLCSDGEEAVEQFRLHKDKIDLVICDMIMPKKNGRDCFFAMKKINPDVRFILASGFTQRQDTQEMQREGLSGYIKKPFRTSDFIQMVQSVLRGG